MTKQMIITNGIDAKMMSEPSYEEHIQMLIAFLNSDIDKNLKIEMVKALVKKFGGEKDEID